MSEVVPRWISETLRACIRDPKVVAGGGFILFLLVLAIGAPDLSPKDPLEQDLILGVTPPHGFAGAEPGYLLGTDDLGRDVLSRLIWGSRVALTVAFVAATLAAALGAALGLLAGWYRGWVDAIISRLVEIWMAFPPVLLSILLVAVFGARRRIGHRGYRDHRLDAVLPRRARGDDGSGEERLRHGRARDRLFANGGILIREILPNVMPVLIALISLEMGIAVIVEAILSFVGLSVSSDVPTWGGMIAQGRQILHQGWWVLAAPLVALFLTVLAFNLLGEGLRRARSGHAPMNPPVLALSNLSAVSDHDRAILRDVSLEVARGETCGLVGESGAGKSTVAKAILGILPRTVRVTGGEVKFEGADLLKIKAGPLRRLIGERIALIPQDPMTALNPARRIEAQ
jgi:ABC-type dipeptide/oligopeptide/nickel transport system permease subunit